MVFYVTRGKKSNIGKSYEQLALTDYLLLDWMGKKWKNSGQQPERVKNIETIIEKLNNFAPVVPCKDPGCKNIANYFPISITIGKYQVQKNGVPYTRVGVTEVSIPKDRVYCEEHKPRDDKLFSNEVLYEIKLDTLVELKKKYPKWQQWVNGIKSVQKVLYDYAGFKGKKTEKNCNDFIYNLPQKEGEVKYNFKTPKESIPNLMSGLKDNLYLNDPSVIEVEKNIAIYLKNPNDDNGEKLAVRLDGLGNRQEGTDRLAYLSKKYSQKFGVEKTKKLFGGYYTIFDK